MDENFSPGVRDVITFSKEEALRLGHDFIGTEHLLLGLIRKAQLSHVKKVGLVLQQADPEQANTLGKIFTEEFCPWITQIKVLAPFCEQHKQVASLERAGSMSSESTESSEDSSRKIVRDYVDLIKSARKNPNTAINKVSCQHTKNDIDQISLGLAPRNTNHIEITYINSRKNIFLKENQVTNSRIKVYKPRVRGASGYLEGNNKYYYSDELKY